MKKILIMTIVALIRISATAQNKDWPIGTFWVYEQIEYGPYDPNNYAIVEVKRDTVVKNIASKIIRQYSYPNNAFSAREFIISKQNNKVYFYDQSDSSFYLIYDFDLTVGDTFSAHVGPFLNFDKFTDFKIDSISFEETNHGPIKHYFLNKLSGNAFNYPYGILEGIGNLFYFFQTYGVADPPLGGYLRCFTNSSIVYPKDRPCKIPTQLNDFSKLNLNISQRAEEIQINGHLFSDTKFSFCDLNGKLLYAEKLNTYQSQHTISTQQFLPGIYILTISFDQGIQSVKIIK
ncbi:MAG: T9SS type A sorting domain-containing protein [Saprospiraceae bacterium]|jgi:hypothetical protein|nr:T9SS type A sorting domain-containing protein [Saprospiraceae bacterium]